MARPAHLSTGPVEDARAFPAQDLPVLALSRPRDVAVVAQQLLDRSQDKAERCYAQQALGIASRELGDVTQALRHLRAARSNARRLDGAREADVEASLGATLAFAGRTTEGLRYLDAAANKVSGTAAARIGVRRGFLLQMLGRTGEAKEQLRSAARTLRASHDDVWEARALINLAQALIDGNEPDRAEDALSRAEGLLQVAGQPFEAAIARHNRGLVAALRGEVARALTHYDAAEVMYAEVGARPPELSEARCAALLSAGLPDDALASGREALGLLRRTGASPAYLATALVRAGEAARAAGDPETARQYAAEAALLFRRQGRVRGENLARLDVLQARHAAGEGGGRLLRDAEVVAATADRHHMTEAVAAHLLAGQLALAMGDNVAAQPHLARAAAGRRSGSALARVLGWQASALRARAAGRRRTMFAACERGLQDLDAHQLTLGALELRTAATSHGTQLAGLAVREALAAGSATELLRWTERWRATAATLPPVRPPDDDVLAEELRALRRAGQRLEEGAALGQPVAGLERECRRLEAQVRRHTQRAAGDGEPRTDRPGLSALLDSLGEVRLVELVHVDDVLHVLVADAQGVRHRVAGSWSQAIREIEFARFGLHRLASGRPSRLSAAALLDGQRMQEQLLGEAVGDLGTGPVVVAPPASLQAVPWALLPALAGRPFSVAPSGAVWCRCAAVDPPEDRSVLLVAGPDLPGGGAEVLSLASHYERADILKDGTATAERVLAGLDGRWLAHIAAHGTFRADNPLFSCLRLDDGPLTLVDLSRLRRAPYRLVASSCNSGVSAASGSDELLGLASALAPLGTAGLLASVVPVNDAAAVPWSHHVHGQFRAGATTGEALCQARAVACDPVERATASSFVAFGAA